MQLIDIEPDVLEAAQGDRGAYRRLVDRYRGLVTSIALARTRDVAASEDVAQEVFLLAWNNLRALRNPASFAPWLRQTTRFRAEHFARSRSRRPDAQPTTVEKLQQVADPLPTPDHALLAKERGQVLSQALELLRDEDRELIVLYYREGSSVAQVASLLGLSEMAVKKRLSRAREQLRDDLETRLGIAAKDSSPDERFAVLVLAMLPPGTPPAAAMGTGLGPPIALKWAVAVVTGGAVATALVWQIATGFPLFRRAPQEGDRGSPRIVLRPCSETLPCAGGAPAQQTPGVLAVGTAREPDRPAQPAETGAEPVPPAEVGAQKPPDRPAKPSPTGP